MYKIPRTSLLSYSPSDSKSQETITTIKNYQHTMCRNHLPRFACWHAVAQSPTMFECRDPATCERIELVEYTIHSMCTPCIKELRAANTNRQQLGRMGFVELVDYEYLIVRGVLDLAAMPNERYRRFEERDDNPFVYVYDSENINEFDGPLTEETGERFYDLVEEIGDYILDTGTPDLTENETRLFDQVRTASLKFRMLKHEIMLQHEEREEVRRNQDPPLVGRLRERMIPCPVPKDSPNCLVCY